MPRAVGVVAACSVQHEGTGEPIMLATGCLQLGHDGDVLSQAAELRPKIFGGFAKRAHCVRANPEAGRVLSEVFFEDAAHVGLLDGVREVAIFLLAAELAKRHGSWSVASFLDLRDDGFRLVSSALHRRGRLLGGILLEAHHGRRGD